MDESRKSVHFVAEDLVGRILEETWELQLIAAGSTPRLRPISSWGLILTEKIAFRRSRKLLAQ